MRTRSAARKDGRFGRLHGDDLDRSVLLLEEAARTRDGTSRAHPGDKHIHRTVGGGPDLGSRGLVVGLQVGGIRELARDDGAGCLGSEGIGAGDGTLHALRAGREHDLRSVGCGEFAALDRHGVGHDEDHAVAALGGDHGKAYAGISARGLDDGTTGGKTAGTLGVVYDGERDAVLNRAAGVGRLVLAEDAGTSARSKHREVDERGVSDKTAGSCCI